MKRKIVKAMVQVHEAGGSVRGEAIKMVLPWPVSAASAILGLCMSYRAHRNGDLDARSKAMVGVGTDALAAIPGAHLAIRGTGLIFHAVRRVKHHFGPSGEPDGESAV